MASLKDRLLTRRGAEAIMAPSSIIVASAATAVGIAIGAPIVAAVGVGVATYAGWVTSRLPAPAASASTGLQEVDLNRLRDPWRHYVREALDARQRFGRAVVGADAGAIRDRLATIGERIDDGVGECWRIALRGQDLEAALAQLAPVAEVEQRLGHLRTQPASTTTDGLIEALEGQAESYRRIAGTATDARNRLEILEARLDEAVARAIELSLQTADTTDLGGLQADVHAVVGELEALRRGLEETAGRTTQI